jgi:methylenetetrahydrofolate--tRNA-(uracil-5-)-methyltransferase
LSKELVVVGGGLAGSEAAWQAASRGLQVTLYEMRPTRPTEVHRTDGLAEVVCSNSMGSLDPTRAPGLLKEELGRLGSMVMACAKASAVPAGQALAVDRAIFSALVEERLKALPNLRIVREEVAAIPPGRPVILASGPLTSPPLADALATLLGQEYLYFYDAASPIVATDSLRHEALFAASRYGKNGDDYLNCPLDAAQYEAFLTALTQAETVPFKDLDRPRFFESCLPIEELAARGRDTLRFGPMKPVGLVDPKTGAVPHACVQLRAENLEGTMYNLVGFQTRMKWGEQRRVLRLLPGLENAEFLRYGVMHRNIFVNSPTFLAPTNELKGHEGLFLAGCLVGSEGYVECVASGWLAGVNAVRQTQERPMVSLPSDTCIGSLMRYLTESRAASFQPMNVNFGLFPPLSTAIRHKEARQAAIVERARQSLTAWLETADLGKDLVACPS